MNLDDFTRFAKESFGPDYPSDVKFHEPVFLKDDNKTAIALGMFLDAGGNYVLRFISTDDFKLYQHRFFSEIYPFNSVLTEFGKIETSQNVKDAYDMGFCQLNEMLHESLFVPGERYITLLQQNENVLLKVIDEVKTAIKISREKTDQQIQTLEEITLTLPEGVYQATSIIQFSPYNEKDIEYGGISPNFKPTITELIVEKNATTNNKEILFKLNDYPDDPSPTIVNAKKFVAVFGKDPAFQDAMQMLKDIHDKTLKKENTTKHEETQGVHRKKLQDKAKTGFDKMLSHLFSGKDKQQQGKSSALKKKG